MRGVCVCVARTSVVEGEADAVGRVGWQRRVELRGVECRAVVAAVGVLDEVLLVDPVQLAQLDAAVVGGGALPVRACDAWHLWVWLVGP